MEKTIITIVSIIAVAFVFWVAAIVGKGRANAMEECYKAAQVNHNIKCEVSND